MASNHISGGIIVKSWVWNLLIVTSTVGILTVNLKQAQALPPAAWHCASQENCFALAVDQGVIVTREGVEKEHILDMGAGSGGHVTVDKGIIMVTRSASSMVYLHDIANGKTCSIDVKDSTCRPGVIMEHNWLTWANFICLQRHIKLVKLDCSKYVDVNGYASQSHIVTDGSIGYISYNVGNHIGVFANAGVSPISINNLTSINGLVYNSGNLYVSGTGDASTPSYGIFSKPIKPIGSGPSTLFKTMPKDAQFLNSTADYMIMSGRMNGYIIPFANPNNMVTVNLNNAGATAISPATAGEHVRAYFIEKSGAPTVHLRVFDETGKETSFSPINTPSWDVAYIAPTLKPVCGNGLLEPGEKCDDEDFGTETCKDHGFTGGKLTCNKTCDTISVSGCWKCGDNTKNPGEECDGTDLGTATCSDSGYTAGTVSCNADCTVNYEKCSTCGNGIIEASEECEGADLNKRTCVSEGFVKGKLTCKSDCTVDTSACTMCGNNVPDKGEKCDGTATPGISCQTFGKNYTGGQLMCNSTCDDYDDSGCYTCGDGNVDANEECDGANLNSQDCGTLGLGTGTLSCFENCTFDLTKCENVQTEYCGNGIKDAGEECDDGNRSNSDSCSESCKIIPPSCGVGSVDAGEECDGNDLNGATCESLGYQSGVLYCGNDCKFRTDSCSFDATPYSLNIDLAPEPESGELGESLQKQYEAIKSGLTYKCVPKEVNGDLVLTTTAGSFCSVRATNMNTTVKDRMFSFIYIPKNSLESKPVIRFYKNGEIAQNSGGHITAYQGLKVKTIIVEKRLYSVTQQYASSVGMQFLSVNPTSQVRGRWLSMEAGTGSISVCTNATNCVKLFPTQGQVIVNLDALTDLSKTKPPKLPENNGGCSVTISSTPFPLILLVLTLLFTRRRRNHPK